MAVSTIGSLFGRSPIKPIQAHMEKAVACVELLESFFQALMQDDWDKAKAIGKTVVKMEKEADKQKHSVRKHLPNNLFLPVPRSDLLELITAQDKLPNCTRDITGLMIGRKMGIPENLHDIMVAYVATAKDASTQALQAINELDELLSTGFSGPELKTVERLLNLLDKAEHKNDKQQIKIRSALFKLESDLPPVDVMFLYKIIDLIGELADAAQSVGSRLRLLLAR